MTERAFVADAREAKGLHDGSIRLLVRVNDAPTPESQPVNPMWECINGVWWHTIPDSEDGSVAKYDCPFGGVGDRLRAVCGPGEPCGHRGCLSHVTHVCEGCGRGWAGILLDVTDVRVVRLDKVTEEDYFAMGFKMPPIESYDVIPVNWWWIMELGKIYDKPREGYPQKANPWLWLGTVQKVEA